MPKKYKDCVEAVKGQGKSEGSAHAICTAADAGGIKEYRKREAKAATKKKARK